MMGVVERSRVHVMRKVDSTEVCRGLLVILPRAVWVWSKHAKIQQVPLRE